MLRKLDFEVTFASTGKTLKGSHSFQTGLTAITGPNESGKSMRLEMIRFALWGAKALRAAGAAYKKLNVSLQFDVAGQPYNIVRSKSNATLDKDSRQVAVGTTPVNAEIERIFGYNLHVFDAANAVLQGEIEALSKMTSADRKRMVDKVIGLDAIDDIIKEITAEMTGQRMIVESLSKQVIDDYPAPEMPENYEMTSDDAACHVQATINVIVEKNKIESNIMALNCDNPGEQPVFTVQERLPILYGHQAKKNALRSDRADFTKKLDALRSIPSNGLTSEDLEKLQQYLNDQGPEQWKQFNDYFERRSALEAKLPKMMPEKIDLYVRYHEVLPSYNKIKELEAHKIACPECHHEFTLMDDQIVQLKLNIPQDWDMEKMIYDFGQDGYPTMNQLLSDRSNWAVWNLFKQEPVPEKPKLELYGDRRAVQQKLDDSAAWMKAQKDILEVENQLAENAKQLEAMSEDYDALIATRQVEEDAIIRYDANKSKWVKFQNYIEETRDWLKNLGDPEAELARYQKLEKDARAFENAVEEWKAKTEGNEKLKAELAEQKTKLENLTNVRKGLNALKPRIKMYLVPSLNRVASNLLSQMTNGQRNIINVNEEFDISVDNQSIEELSGSAKAVANLAIRIGLGTVLTSKMFSVLLADEVDAAMDDERAAYTAECLRNLTKTFEQVILVSHKQPEADHQIKV